MATRGSWTWGRAALLATLIMAAAPGCDPSLFKKTRFRSFDFNTAGKVRLDTRRIRLSGPLYKGARAKEDFGTLDVLRIFAKKDAELSYGFARLNHDLRPPFRVEVTVGMLDPKLPLSMTPAFACLELDGRDTEPLEYFGNCIQFHSGGAQAFGIMKGSSNLGTLDLSGADSVDLAMEAAGGNLYYEARATGAPSFQTVAMVKFSGSSFPLVPSLGGNNIPGKTGFAFSTPRLLWNGARPSQERIEDEVADLVDCAWEAYADYCDSLAYEDFQTADEDIEDALDYIDEAGTLTATLPPSRERTKALRALSSSLRFMEKAADALDREKPFKLITRMFTRSLDKASDALPLLRPFRVNL